jgi:hypothetical protein
LRGVSAANNPRRTESVVYRYSIGLRHERAALDAAYEFCFRSLRWLRGVTFACGRLAHTGHDPPHDQRDDDDDRDEQQQTDHMRRTVAQWNQ